MEDVRVGSDPFFLHTYKHEEGWKVEINHLNDRIRYLQEKQAVQKRDMRDDFRSLKISLKPRHIFRELFWKSAGRMLNMWRQFWQFFGRKSRLISRVKTLKRLM